MRANRRPPVVVILNVVERVYNPRSKKVEIVKGSSRSLTLRETSAAEVWALVLPIIDANTEEERA